jgi:CheY-like chemotaxis protein
MVENSGFREKCLGLLKTVEWSRTDSAIRNGNGLKSTKVRLCHRPRTIAVLDDDPVFVELLSAMLRRTWTVLSFSNALECRAALQKDAALSSADLHSQRLVVDRWREGAVKLVPAILDYWSSSAHRRELIKVLVIDDHLPEIESLDFLSRLPHWHGQRLLLGTRVYDEQAIVAAFNGGLIDRWIEKRHRDFPSRLTEDVRELFEREDDRLREIWAATLSADQRRALADQNVAAALAATLDEPFQEWIVVGRPFGIIGLNREDVPCWLPLAMRSSLSALSKMAMAEGMSAELAAQISSGRKLSDVELRQSLGVQGVHAMDAWAPGGGDLLIAARHMEIECLIAARTP